MQRMTILVAAGAIVVAPASAFAGPPASGTLSPHHDTGQPNAECEDGGPNAEDD